MAHPQRPSSVVSRLTSAKAIAHNTFWNIFGVVLPLAVAAVAIPSLLQDMGVARFGLLTILWLILNYFSLFDLGLGQAVARMVAERLGQGTHHTLPALIGTAETFCLTLGLVAGVILFSASNWIANLMAPASPVLAMEASHSLQLIATGMPFVVGTMAWTGTLQGFHAFKHLSLIRLFTGIWSFAVPALLAKWNPSLVGAAMLLVVGRLAAWLVQYRAVRRCTAVSWGAWSRVDFNQFLHFGGWLTVSKIVGPLMVYFDRFVIATLLGASAVAYYAAPFEVIFRLLMLPTTLAQVLMPAMAMVGAGSRQAIMTKTASRVVLIGTAYVALATILFAAPGLTFWLGKEFATKSTVVLQVLSIGLVVNGVAQIPFSQLLAMGRSDLTARVHLIELPVYGIGVWWGVSNFGIAGAAVAWVIRAGIDALALYWLAEGHKEAAQRSCTARMIELLAVTAVLGLMVPVRLNTPVRITILITSLAIATATLLPMTRKLWKGREFNA